MSFAAISLTSGSPMQNLHHLEDSVLIDMLAEYTLKFTQLFCIYKGIHPNNDYHHYKRKIQAIIEELALRGLAPTNRTSNTTTESTSLLSK